MESVIAAVLLFGLAVLLLYGGTRKVAELEPALATETWKRADAEVISVLHVNGQHFVMVSYQVGREIWRNDLMRPITGAAPAVGDRVHVRYDPASPARVVLDPAGPTFRRPRPPQTIAV